MNQIKSIVALIVCLMLGFTSLSSAEGTADSSTVSSNRIYAILSTALSDPTMHTELFSDNAYQSIVAQIEDESFILPDDVRNQSVPYTYDASMRLLEVEWGPYHSWTIEQKHQFDLLMVSAKQIPYCFNLLPDDTELSQEAALSLALQAISERYGIMVDVTKAPESVVFSYYPSDAKTQKAMWRIGVNDQDSAYIVHLLDGEVILCKQERMISNLDLEYDALCEERGAFFTWSLEDKMHFAQSLPVKLAAAEKSGTNPMNEDDLVAIANYGFCLPTAECISQDEAYQIAVTATSQEYGLPEGWEAQSEVYYSLSTGHWTSWAVNKILRSQVYVGDLVQGKSKIIDHQQVKASEDEYTIVQNTHEAIISRELFEHVRTILDEAGQKAVAARKKSFTPNPLKGKVFCGHCGRSLHRGENERKKSGNVYCLTCLTRYRYDRNGCPGVYIYEHKLITALTELLQKELDAVLGCLRLPADQTDEEQIKIETIQHDITSCRREIDRLHGLKRGLYENLLSGVLTQEEYQFMRKRYDAQIEQQQGSVQAHETALTMFRRHDKLHSRLQDDAQLLRDRPELAVEVVNRLIDRIEITHDRQITVFYSFADEVKAWMEAHSK